MRKAPVIAVAAHLASGAALAQQPTVYDLETLPKGAMLNKVTAAPATIAGRNALKVEINDVNGDGEGGVDFGDAPTFVEMPVTLENGTIEVDVLGRLNATAPPDVRAFIGIAYRIQGNGKKYESIYLRPLNGRKLKPPPPRDKRAVQYYAAPDWPFDRLRENYPDGRFEAGADIGPGEWIHLRVDIDGKTARVFVNGAEALTLAATKAAPHAGTIGLWVDLGTEGYFSNLRVTPR